MLPKRTQAIGLAITLLVASLCACDDGAPPADRGGPFANVLGSTGSTGSSDAGAKDGGASDAAKDRTSAVDAKVGSGDAKGDLAVGSGGSSTSNPGAGGAGATGDAPLPTCDACEQANCSPGHNMLPDYITACHAPTDANGQPAKAMGGPAAGQLRKDLCEAVLSCVRQNPDKCVTWAVATQGFEDVSSCYCGQGVSDDDCIGNKATGPCKVQIEAAAEISGQSTAGADVAQNFVDWQTYAIGAAVDLTSECDLRFCRVSCLGLAGPNSLVTAGTGGQSPSGGGGSGGSGGTGGTQAIGSGGSVGSGGGSGSGGSAGSSSVTYSVCRTCEQMMCPALLSACEQAAGVAASGPAAGTPRKDLCQSVVACVRATRCSVDGDVAPCYCGTADVSGACQGGAANGVCKAAIEAAAESTDPAVVTGARFTNPDPYMKMPYAIGFATDLIGCDGYQCGSALCVAGDPIGGGTGGGEGGTGGGAGSGGSPGSGGGATGGATSAGSGGGAGSSGSGGRTGAFGSGGAPGAGGAPGSGGAPGAGGALANTGFDVDSAAWSPEFGMVAAWTSKLDVAGSASSGALGVTNAVTADIAGSTMGGARQCVAVSAGTSYAASAQLFIPTGQTASSSAGAAAGLDLLFYRSLDCSGAITAAYASAMVSGPPSVWTLVQGSTPAPAGARSVAVRLIVTKPFRSASFQAFFDNLSFRAP